MTRPPLRRLAVFAAAALTLGAALWLLWPSQTARFALPVPGKGDITYTCDVTSTKAEAKARAEAAHQAFQSGLTQAAASIAARMQAAMLKASAGDRSDLDAANAAYQALSKTLRADLRANFACEVDTTLKPAG